MWVSVLKNFEYESQCWEKLPRVYISKSKSKTMIFNFAFFCQLLIPIPTPENFGSPRVN